MDWRGFHDLVQSARNGDGEAMDRLLASVRPHMQRLARDQSDPARASQSASDLVQEAEVRVWQGLEGFRGGKDDQETRARFESWIASIIERLGIDLHRKRNASRRKAPGYYLVPLEEVEADGSGAGRRGAARSPSLHGGSAPSASLRAAERSRLVRGAVDRVPDADGRRILQGYYFEGLTLRQVSERLPLPYHKVKERYREAMRLLEAALGDMEV